MADPKRNQDQTPPRDDQPLDVSDTTLPLEADSGEIERLRTDLDEAQDRLLRAQAELENYRKRARRELDEERRYAELPLIRDLLPVIDNLRRFIAASAKTPGAESLVEGASMVAQTFEAVLARHHCHRIEALHQTFDPTFHEAISQQPSDEFPPQTVIAVAHDGYVLHDRVVRPAQVVVSVPLSAERAL